MSSSADEHHRYVLELEEQNAAMRAMIASRDVAYKSVTAEVEHLRTRVAEADRTVDEIHRELDLARHTLRVIRASSNEYQNATLGGAPQKPQADDDKVRTLRESASY
jgi:chromosome segregation ATPase